MKKIIIAMLTIGLTTATGFAQHRPDNNNRNSNSTRNQPAKVQTKKQDNRPTANYKNPHNTHGNKHVNSTKPRYTTQHHRGHTVQAVPKHAVKVRHGNAHYYYNNGVYYKPYNRGYVVSRAPIGIRVSVLPVGYRPYTVNRVNYYYHAGNYYRRINNYYEVVLPPVGAIVENIPANYEKVEIYGETYFIADGIQYKPVMVDNEIWYQVIKVSV